MTKYIIYKYTSPSKRTYIGLTSDEERRKKDHRNSEHDYAINTAFTNALRKYGYDKFEYEVIDSTYTWQELGEREKYWIKFYDSINSGYNICEGGHGAVRYTISDKQVEDIRLLGRIGEKTLKEISQVVGVSTGVVCTLLQGKGTRNLEPVKREKKSRKGSTNGQAKLTEEQVSEIRTKLQNGASRKEMQFQYNVSKTLIQLIATNQAWGHASEGYEYTPLEVNGNARLTPEIVSRLKQDLDKLTRKEIASKYGISVPTVDQIKAGKTWKHVK